MSDTDRNIFGTHILPTILITSLVWFVGGVINDEIQKAAVVTQDFEDHRVLVNNIPALTNDARSWLITVEGPMKYRGPFDRDVNIAACVIQIRSKVRHMMINFVPDGIDRTAGIHLASRIESKFLLDTPMCSFQIETAMVKEYTDESRRL